MELIKRNTDYALRVLTLMGKYKKGQIIFAKDLAASEAVPLVYLHKILQQLQRSGIIKSYRGRFGGGFSLNREIKKVSLREIMKIAQGEFALNRCFIDHGCCSRIKHCPIHKQLQQVQKNIDRALNKVTLAGLVKARIQAEK
ncbi:MAG: Rrf2 family transcriptional regulator [bacterium]|nr:Rrf2 family transcriptional regulator [bacterium]MDD5353788.1 Rrf2 family transcriptional regulator [bacterium]MDD5757036.1 Rrf2 family transcriptional regulator [bacterium]